VGGAVAASGAGKPTKGGKPAKKAADSDEEDDDDAGDMFGDSDDDGDALAAIKAKQEAAKAAAKPAKKKAVEKTSVVWEVKPADVDVDLDAVAAKIHAIAKDGLSWSAEFPKKPIAFGLFKLMVQCVVEDEKVSLQEIEDEIASWEDLISSVDQLDMQKVT
jgi:elongation factor 1-beta